jgi:hypothetical protein
MVPDLADLERHLASKSKPVRLKAIKFMLRHPDASPLQLVRCLCSEDNRNFEFQEVFELGSAMHAAWPRLDGVKDPSVYEFLYKTYTANPEGSVHQVVHVLELLKTRQALDLLEKVSASAPGKVRGWIEHARRSIEYHLANRSG